MTKARCSALHAVPGGVGNRGSETPTRMRREERARARPTREEWVGGPRRRAVTDDPHCCSQTLGTHGQPGTLVPSPDVNHLVEGQTESSMQCSTFEEPLGATPAVCALKCQLHVVFGQGLPLRWEPRGGGASPAGPRPKAHLRMQRSAEAAGPSCAQ